MANVTEMVISLLSFMQMVLNFGTRMAKGTGMETSLL
jgi:hypothetical protein